MKGKLLNNVLAFIFAITLLISVFSVSIYNKHFHDFNHQKYDCELKIEDTNLPDKWIVYSVDLVLIIIVGEIFLHTKKIHSIENIFIIQFIYVVLLYGFIYLNINKNNIALYYNLHSFLKIYLGIGILLFEVGIFKKYIQKIRKK